MMLPSSRSARFVQISLLTLYLSDFCGFAARQRGSAGVLTDESEREGADLVELGSERLPLLGSSSSLRLSLGLRGRRASGCLCGPCLCDSLGKRRRRLLRLGPRGTREGGEESCELGSVRLGPFVVCLSTVCRAAYASLTRASAKCGSLTHGLFMSFADLPMLSWFEASGRRK